MDTSTETGRMGIDPQESSRTIPLAAEILGYVGGALALGAIAALLTTYWVELGFYGRVGIALGVALAGLLGGWAMARSKAPAANRLSQFLLFVGVIGAGAAVGFDVYEMAATSLGPISLLGGPDVMFGSLAADWAWFAGFATMAVVGGAVWWRRRTVMQHLAFGLGVGIGTLLLLPLLPFEGPEWGAGAVLALVGVVWGALGLKGWLPPENAALTLAAFGVLGGIQIMESAWSPLPLQPHWALWVGLVASVAMLVASLLIKRMVFLGFGAGGIVVFSFQLIDTAFRGTIGAPIALLVAGLLFVAMSVIVAVMLPWMSRTSVKPELVAPVPSGEFAAETAVEALPAEQPEPAPIPLAAEILGYVGGAFAVGAAIALMTTFWTQLGLYGRGTVALLGAVIGIVGGFLIGRQGSRAAHRLEQFMLAIGTIAVGFAVGIVAYEFTLAEFGPMSDVKPIDTASNLAIAAGALAAAVAGFAIWWRRRTGLQLLVFAAALLVALTNGFDTLIVARNLQLYWASGAVMIAFGVLCGIGALVHFLTPENLSLSIASFCVLMGIQQATFSPIVEGVVPEVAWTGLAVAVAMIVASIPLRRGVLLGFGAAGVVIFSAEIVSQVFGGQIAGPIMLLVIGIIFVAMAVLVAIVLPRLKAHEPSGPPEPPPISPHRGAHA